MLEVDGKEERLTSEEHTHRPPSTNAHKLTTVSNIRLRKFPSDSYSYLRLFVTPFIRASREEHDQGKQALRVRHTNYCWVWTGLETLNIAPELQGRDCPTR